MGGEAADVSKGACFAGDVTVNPGAAKRPAVRATARYLHDSVTQLAHQRLAVV